MPTLAEVLKAFPRTPINIEIKGRTPDEETEEYVQNAEVLARLLKNTKRRDLIVVSFQQAAVDRFHELAPKVDLAPGITGAASWLLSGGSPGPGVVAFQVPITFIVRRRPSSTSPPPTTWRAPTARATPGRTGSRTRTATPPAPGASLIDMCVDGTMTSHPRAYERVLRKHKRPGSCP